MTTLNIQVPVVETVGGEEHVTIMINGIRLYLVGPDSRDMRGLAVALFTAKAVRLEIEESKNKVPEVFTMRTAAPSSSSE